MEKHQKLLTDRRYGNAIVATKSWFDASTVRSSIVTDDATTPAAAPVPRVAVDRTGATGGAATEGREGGRRIGPSGKRGGTIIHDFAEGRFFSQ
jgi:hypothetical protein